MCAQLHIIGCNVAVQTAANVSTAAMQDLKDRLEKLLADAEDCDLIGNLASDVAKRATFRRMAEQFRLMAADLKAEIASREAASGSDPAQP